MRRGLIGVFVLWIVGFLPFIILWTIHPAESRYARNGLCPGIFDTPDDKEWISRSNEGITVVKRVLSLIIVNSSGLIDLFTLTILCYSSYRAKTRPGYLV